MTPKTIIEKAKELIMRDGWCQRTSRKSHWARREEGVVEVVTGRCLVGALSDARAEIVDPIYRSSGWDHNTAIMSCGIRDNAFDIAEAVCKEIDDRPPVASNVVRWNDTPGRTKEEVLAFLDRCIERARVLV